MAWNKPNSNTVDATSSSRPSGRGKMPRLRALHLALSTFVVALGALSLYLFSNGEATSSSLQKKERGRIKEVTPAAAPTNTAPKAVKKRYSEMTNDEKLKTIRDRYGNNIPKNLQPTVYYLEHPAKVEYHPARTKYDIFTRRCDQEIASLVTVTPGTWFMRKPTFDEHFDNDFANSVADKIEILDSDTAEQREMKQAVIDAKKELSRILKETGEKPSSVMSREAEALYALGEYQRSLEDELHAIKMNSDYSDQDLIDFVTAANQMLEKKGAGKIQMPNLTYRHVSLKAAARREAAKASVEPVKNK